MAGLHLEQLRLFRPGHTSVNRDGQWRTVPSQPAIATFTDRSQLGEHDIEVRIELAIDVADREAEAAGIAWASLRTWLAEQAEHAAARCAGG